MSEGRGHWFLPETPDVLGLLRAQIGVTIEGLEAFAAWAGGEEAAVEAVAEAEDRGDVARRDLLNALRSAFVTPLEPEDVFMLSRSLDWILNYTSDLVREATCLAAEPDAGIAAMATLIVDGVRSIDDAVAHLDSGPDLATASADEAIATVRRLDDVYYRGMADLLEIKGMRGRVSHRELYRRCLRIGELVVDAAERVVYAVVKQS